MTENSKVVFYGCYIFIVLPTTLLYLAVIALVIDVVISSEPHLRGRDLLAGLAILAIPGPVIFAYWRMFSALIKKGCIGPANLERRWISLVLCGGIYSVMSLTTVSIIRFSHDSIFGFFLLVGAFGLPLILPAAHLLYEYRWVDN